ncbi:MAG: hypothetical protein J5545_05755 [Bacteroidaceae bacterium]|nr:hypothetical protein [Bacteroidaceae bacterium]
MKTILLLSILFAFAVTPASAQRSKRPASKARPAAKAPAKNKPAAANEPSAIEQAQHALSLYDVSTAREILDKEMAVLTKKKQPTEAVEALMEQVQQITLKLHATEHIVIIDSVVCDKNKFLNAILLNRENGRIDTYASTYHTADKNGATLYENELANKRYLAVPKGKNGALRLATSDKIGEQWSEPHLLTGLATSDLSQNYPFLLSDGVTLYFAATGPESIGGYDIFVTRSDGDDGSFLTPENVGFPFNSPANDYLLVIDELHQLGWFVSDRRQPKGKVCVYTFIPNATRQVYGDQLSEKQLAARARIASIKDTWNSQTPEAQKRLAALRMDSSNEGKQTAETFQFVIDDKRTYTQLSDFQSPQAKQKMMQWLQLSKNVKTDQLMLERLRDNYATAPAEQRPQLAQSIRKLESTHYPQLQQLKQLEKEIRNTEISHK